MTLSWICSIAIANKWLENKQGNKIEGIVVNRVSILGFFSPNQGQDLKPSAAHLYPNIGGVPPGISVLDK